MWECFSDQIAFFVSSVAKTVKAPFLRRPRSHDLGLTCDCNYILFTKLPWPGDSEGTFRSSSQAATCPSVYHTRWRLHTVPFNAERQAGELWIPIFIVFGLTRPGIEPESTASVADALSTRPLIGNSTLVTLLRSWIRRFTMIISTWWFRTSCKFKWEEVKRQSENLENGKHLSGWGFVQK